MKVFSLLVQKASKKKLDDEHALMASTMICEETLENDQHSSTVPNFLDSIELTTEQVADTSLDYICHTSNARGR